MRDFIHADSLSFLSIDGLYKALGESKRADIRPQYCDACFTGDYPTTLTDQDDAQVTDQFSLLAERVCKSHFRPTLLLSSAVGIPRPLHVFRPCRNKRKQYCRQINPFQENWPSSRVHAI